MNALPPRICPCCGYDLELDQPILMNDFAMSGAGYPLFYKDKQVPLSPAKASLCYALMKAYPRKLSVDALLERCTDGREDTNIIRVHVHRIRDALKSIGAPNPIKTMHSSYIWDPRS